MSRTRVAFAIFAALIGVVLDATVVNAQLDAPLSEVVVQDPPEGFNADGVVEQSYDATTAAEALGVQVAEEFISIFHDGYSRTWPNPQNGAVSVLAVFEFKADAAAQGFADGYMDSLRSTRTVFDTGIEESLGTSGERPEGSGIQHFHELVFRRGPLVFLTLVSAPTPAYEPADVITLANVQLQRLADTRPAVAERTERVEPGDTTPGLETSYNIGRIVGFLALPALLIVFVVILVRRRKAGEAPTDVPPEL